MVAAELNRAFRVVKPNDDESTENSNEATPNGVAIAVQEAEEQDRTAKEDKPTGRPYVCHGCYQHVVQTPKRARLAAAAKAKAVGKHAEWPHHELARPSGILEHVRRPITCPGCGYPVESEYSFECAINRTRRLVKHDQFDAHFTAVRGPVPPVPHNGVRCICGLEHSPHGADDWSIACDGCGVWQHALCVRLTMDIQHAPENYWCEQCKPDLHGGVREDFPTSFERGPITPCPVPLTNRRGVMLAVAVEAVNTGEEVSVSGTATEEFAVNSILESVPVMAANAPTRRWVFDPEEPLDTMRGWYTAHHEEVEIRIQRREAMRAHSQSPRGRGRGRGGH